MSISGSEKGQRKPARQSSEASVVTDRLLDTESPRERKALADRSIRPPTSRKEPDYAAALEEEVGKQYQELRKSKQTQHVGQRATLGRILLDNCKVGAVERQVLEKEAERQVLEKEAGRQVLEKEEGRQVREKEAGRQVLEKEAGRQVPEKEVGPFPAF